MRPTDSCQMRLRKRQRGQSIVELLVTMFAFFTIAFMFVQVAMGFAVANYFQYATFMAARAYLSGQTREPLQKQAGEAVLEAMVKRNGSDRFRSVAQGVGDGNIAGGFVGARNERVRLGVRESRNTAWEQGASYKFKMRMYMMPLIKGAKRGEAAKLELQSESWLGRDPTEEECIQQLLSKKAEKFPTQNGDWLYDNGC